MGEVADLSDLQQEQIMKAHIAGASVILTAQLFGILTTKKNNIIYDYVYTKLVKTSLAKKNSGWNPKVNNRNQKGFWKENNSV